MRCHIKLEIQNISDVLNVDLVCFLLLKTFVFRSELNLGVDVSGFSCVKYYRPTPGGKSFVRVSTFCILDYVAASYG